MDEEEKVVELAALFLFIFTVSRRAASHHVVSVTLANIPVTHLRPNVGLNMEIRTFTFCKLKK